MEMATGKRPRGTQLMSPFSTMTCMMVPAELGWLRPGSLRPISQAVPRVLPPDRKRMSRMSRWRTSIEIFGAGVGLGSNPAWLELAEMPRLFSRRRSRSLKPPKMPKRSSLTRAYSRHSCFTSQPMQIRFASRVEPPFSGKKASGSVCAHRACSCHARSTSSALFSVGPIKGTVIADLRLGTNHLTIKWLCLRYTPTSSA